MAVSTTYYICKLRYDNEGGVDDIDEIKKGFKKLAIPEYYIHADAAMAGMTLPFIDGSKFYNSKTASKACL